MKKKQTDSVVERFSFTCSFRGDANANSDPDGPWVRYEDLQAALEASSGHFQDAKELARELVEVKAENKRLERELKKLEAKMAGRLL